MSKKLINHYNQADSLLVVSSYPPKNTTYGDNVGGVASFCKNNIRSIAKNRKVVVLAEIIDQPEIYQEDNVLVYRCWKRNFPGIYFDLFKVIKQFPAVKQLLLQFEFALYGEFIITGFFPLFLSILRFIFNKHTFLVLHQVILSLSDLSGHLGWQAQSIKSKIYSFLMRIFYKMLVVFSNKTIVLEDALKGRLLSLGANKNKINVIKHGVDLTLKPVAQNKAKKALKIKPKEFTILSFGFLTWYKGSDLAIKAVQKVIKNHPDYKIKLVLAGGESITQNKKESYQEYVAQLYKLIAKYPQITITGFVPEKMIKTYYSAADLVILPYRTYMSSSGVLSLALSFAKPCLVSDVFKSVFDDVALDQKVKDKIFVQPTIAKFAQAIENFYEQPKQLKLVAQGINQVAQSRNYQLKGKEYLAVLEEKQFGLPSKLVFSYDINDKNN